ncbi:MAG: Nitric oxide-responding transcriptional regulator Dnr (Crp/Fnr family) [uncultured Sulfurovum sp.]|uniref:Nitric oxide-responding transcriptional regulator Dnr (Crp/Fnr family) n=1 Tax=uncultured Sulfurovum sp. TaxID=269237 RepID=A0A6S6U3N6_9BACT|nr:MAG: Nitric oxide-responding transcriptional regulator Dnr (Crp/Fnr family) [uncultured Sulfurovum sp.]
MKKALYVIVILLLLTQSTFALTRGDVKIIEARENIQYLAQKITTDYFLLYKRPNDLILQSKFKDNIKQLEKNINKIANTTQNTITMNILNFYRYRLEYIQQLPLENPQKKHARLLLDASKYFLEGARSISEQHRYQFSKEESMLIHCKELKYLIESTSKYYMAFQIGLKNRVHHIEMYKIIQEINNNLQLISKYNYPHRLRKKLTKIQNIWEYNQTFFTNLEESSFPNLLLTSNTYIKTLLIELANHHKQNL